MQSKVPITRSEKIKLLNELKAGKISINDLLPVSCSVWVQMDETENYRNYNTGKVLNKDKIPCTHENIIIDILRCTN